MKKILPNIFRISSRLRKKEKTIKSDHDRPFFITSERQESEMDVLFLHIYHFIILNIVSTIVIK